MSASLNKKAKTGRRGELNTPVWSSARRRFRSTRGPQVRGEMPLVNRQGHNTPPPARTRAGARRPAVTWPLEALPEPSFPRGPRRAPRLPQRGEGVSRPRGPPRKAPSAADPARVPPAAGVAGEGESPGLRAPGSATGPHRRPRALRPGPATCRPAPVPAVLAAAAFPPRARGGSRPRGGPAARPEGGGGPGGRAAGEGSPGWGGSRAPPSRQAGSPASPPEGPAGGLWARRGNASSWGPCPHFVVGWLGVRRDFDRVAATCAVAQPPWVLPGTTGSRPRRAPIKTTAAFFQNSGSEGSFCC